MDTVRRLTGKPLKIKTLGGWRVTYNGKAALGGKNQKVILHALILGEGEVYRQDLATLIGESARSANAKASKYPGVKNVLTKLRKYDLQIPDQEDPVILETSQPQASIDLWEFFTHAEFGRHAEAYELISEGQEPHLFAGADDPEHHVWRKTLRRFYEVREETIAAVKAAAGRQLSMGATRELLLARSLVPGVGPSLPIHKVRAKLERLKVPWTQVRPEPKHGKSQPPEYLASLLAEEGTIPTQAIVTGGSGAGKTLTAISTFLRLTDALDEPGAAGADVRTVLYIDPEVEGSEPGFGTVKWLERRLRQAGGSGRPIVIMPHGDAFLADGSNLKTLLNARLFRDHDLLLCCGTQFYSRRLRYEEWFGTHVVRLEPWDVELQKSFACEITGERKCEELEAWLEQDPTRRELCTVPLHLVHVLSLLGDEAEALAEISTPPQLFEGVARMRLRVAHSDFDEDQMLRDLGSLAHRFYSDAAPADHPIRFNTEDLKQHLRAQGHRDVERRADAMINDTLLTVSAPGNTLRFEDPSWGWLFVARHLVHTLLHHPGETLAAFSKLLSAKMASLCEEMLQEKLEHYEEEIHSALGTALRQSEAEDVDRERLTIAREQVGYLLGIVGDRGIRDELAALVEAGYPQREPNHLVRRGITLGLADGGEPRFADLYVEILAAERERGGRTPQRDTNIGFLLSSRGDQRFDPERPARIGREADPVRTVGDLVRSLEDSAHSGSWRVKLYTLLDLGRHPRVSAAWFDAALAEERDRLRGVLARLRRDRARRAWPELDELKWLLDRLDSAQ
jgi:hypothetical protein